MDPGIYAGISNEDYHTGIGYSKSQLDMVRAAPGLLTWARNAPRGKTEAGDIGTAIHCLILEPDEFNNRYAIGPDCDKRSNANKERWEEFYASLGDRSPLTIDEREMLHDMHQSVLAHPEASALLRMPGESELSAYWTDPETGLLLRCRPDRWLRGHRIMLDVKSTDDASKFHWSVRDYRYDVQQAFYSDGAEALDEALDYFLFLVVGKRREMGRYPVRVIELVDRRAIALARDEYRQDLQTILECERTQTWSGIEYMTVPERRYY